MPPINPPAGQPQRHGGRFHCVVVVIATLIVLAGLAILITWLTVRPKRLVYSLEDASVQKYNLTHNNHLYATFQFTVQSHNPNRRILVYYDSIEVYVMFTGETLAFNTIEPFHQPRGNVTRIREKITAQNAAISRSNAKDLRVQAKSGTIELDVFVKARVRFKVGVWKSSHHTAKIECSPVKLSLSQSEKFERIYCDAEI